jgi:hypothetical protein
MDRDGTDLVGTTAIGSFHAAHNERATQSRQAIFPIDPPSVEAEVPSVQEGEERIKTEKQTVKKPEYRNFHEADEIRDFSKGRLELLNIGHGAIGRATLQPGWRWSKSVKPIAKTESFEAPHFQYQVSGTLRIRMDDGTEFDCHAGDIALLPPGHDAWVVGKKPVVVVDFHGMTHYAERK